MDEQVPRKARIDVGMPEKTESDYIEEQKVGEEELKRRTSEILEGIDTKYAHRLENIEPEAPPARKVEIWRKKESPSKLKIIGKKVIGAMSKMGKELVEPTETTSISRIYETPAGRVMEQTIREEPKSALFEWTKKTKTRKLVEPFPGAGFKAVEDWKTTRETKSPIPQQQAVLARKNIMDVLNGAMLTRELNFSSFRTRTIPSSRTGTIRPRVEVRTASAPEFRGRAFANAPARRRQSPIFRVNYQNVSRKTAWVRRPIKPSSGVFALPQRLYSGKRPMTYMIYGWLSNA